MRRMVLLYLIVFGLFFVAGLVLLLSGIGLERADHWLDDRADLFDAVGSRLFNVLCGAILAACIFAVVGGLWQRFVAPRSQMGDAADFVVEPAEVVEVDAADLVVETAGVEETDAEEKKPMGWGCMVVAVIVGYFAWFGMVG